MATSTNKMKRKAELDAARQVMEESIRSCIEEINKKAIEAGKEENTSSQWTKFVELWEELTKLRRLQDPHNTMALTSSSSKTIASGSASNTNTHGQYDYKTALIELVHWLKKKGAKIDGAVPVPEDKPRNPNSKKPLAYKPILSIEPASSVEGNGVFVTRPVKSGDDLIRVPRSLFLTTESIKDHALLRHILRDPLIESIDSIQLAILLLYERYKQNSDYEPYIKSLPRTYSTVYYWTLDDVQSLRGTPIFKDVMTAIITAARAYYEALMIVLVHEIMRKSLFTYDNFIWALSSVYSRQNTVPSTNALKKNLKEGENPTTLALIPGYDMFNYAPGVLTSEFLDEDNCLSLKAMDNLVEGQQAYMWYGDRPNSDLLINQGFVPLDNPSDHLVFEMELLASDSLKSIKTEALTKLGFSIEKHGGIVLPLFPKQLPPSTLLFMRILVCQNKEILGDTEKLRAALASQTKIDDASEATAIKMFKLKCTQIASVFPDNIQEQAKSIINNLITTDEQHVARALTLYRSSQQLIALNSIKLAEALSS